MNKSERNEEWRKRRKASGLCRSCNNPVEGKSPFCRIHRERHTTACMRRKQQSQYVERKFKMLASKARQRGIEFCLTLNLFCEWYDSQEKRCRYCGVEETLLFCQRDVKKRTLTIDRKDNSTGYQIDNICLCCFRCNSGKGNFFTETSWADIAERYIKPNINKYHRL